MAAMIQLSSIFCNDLIFENLDLTLHFIDFNLIPSFEDLIL